MKQGTVYLVGAGPGDPGLITVRGLAYLRQADVIVYDRLSPVALLDEARPDAEQIYAGKRAGHHALPQEEINDLLVGKAREGKTVVRLKGGDPFVFGRGGEEAEACVAAGVPFVIVPGVTSAVAVPAYAGIPVTDRRLTSTLAVVTGHKKDGVEDGNLDWESLAQVDTLVFLMGVTNLPHIVGRLAAAGRSRETPVALVRWGTTPRQQVVTGTLANIVERVQQADLHPPAVIVVGEVVNLRDRFRWFDRPVERPLLGKRVVVTRARDQARKMSALLEEQGAEPVEFPSIAIAPPEDCAPLDEAIATLERYDWVVFTSVNGVRMFWERLDALEKDSRALAGTRVAAIGPSTARALGARGIAADFVPAKYVAEEVAAGLGDVRGLRFLLPRADLAREALARLLHEAGATVDEIVAYRTVPGRGGRDVRALLEEGEIDAVTFTSSSTVRFFLQRIGTEANRLLEGVTVACIGPITARTARELGLHVDVAAEEYTVEGLVRALAERAWSDSEMMNAER